MKHLNPKDYEPVVHQEDNRLNPHNNTGFFYIHNTWHELECSSAFDIKERIEKIMFWMEGRIENIVSQSRYLLIIEPFQNPVVYDNNKNEFSLTVGCLLSLKNINDLKRGDFVSDICPSIRHWKEPHFEGLKKTYVINNEVEETYCLHRVSMHEKNSDFVFWGYLVTDVIRYVNINTFGYAAPDYKFKIPSGSMINVNSDSNVSTLQGFSIREDMNKITNQIEKNRSRIMSALCIPSSYLTPKI